ncbi:MAG TPA: glycosyltransferase family A protein, partial [Solirubrobacteraceae bacterium]|nr:glycosyltransferase family A protein [Solirubrobacteraceae bacterium]
PPLETIVVIDGSADGSAALAAAAGARVIERRRGGVASARNAGVSAARGRLIAFLDQDDVWHPQKLERQLERLDSTPRADVVLCHMLALLMAGTPRPAWLSPEWQASPVRAMIPSAWLVRAALFDDLGGFDERLEIACDSDWLTRAKDRGHRLAMLPQVLLWWRIHGANASYDQATLEREGFAVLRRTAARQRGAASGA